MWRHEVLAIVVEFVIFDNYQTGDCSSDRDIVEGRVGVCSLLLLFRCMGRLDDQDLIRSRAWSAATHSSTSCDNETGRSPGGTADQVSARSSV